MNSREPIEILDHVLKTVTPLWVQPTSRDEWGPIAEALRECEQLHRKYADTTSLHSWLEQNHGSDFAEDTCNALKLLLKNTSDFAKLVREDESECGTSGAETVPATVLYGAFARDAADVFDKLLVAFHKVRGTNAVVERKSP
jgi:hypothetical protein